MTEGSLGSARRWCKHEVGSVIWRKFFLEISSLREARVFRFAAVNINIYDIPLEKFRIMWMALFWNPSNCSVCHLVRA